MRYMRSGFTLIEILIVVSIVAIVSLAIYSTFGNGIKIWQRLNEEVAEEDVNIFLDKFAADLRNSFKFTGIDFSGGKQKLEFATLIDSARLHTRSVGKAVYFYDDRAQALNIAETDFSEVYEEKEGLTKKSLKNIKALNFLYYLYDEEKKEYVWRDEYSQEGLPSAVKVELEIKDGTQEKKFVRVVGLACGH